MPRVETIILGPLITPLLMAFFTSTSAKPAASVPKSRIVVKPFIKDFSALLVALMVL